METDAINAHKRVTGLIPTQFTCISIVVPKANVASSYIRGTFYKSIESNVFICIVIVFTVGRIVSSKSPIKQWLNIFYSTFAVFLLQPNLTPKTNAERILYGTMLVSSIFTSVLLSTMMYTNLVKNPSSKHIQTLNQLAASKYKILALRSEGYWIEEIRFVQCTNFVH